MFCECPESRVKMLFYVRSLFVSCWSLTHTEITLGSFRECPRKSLQGRWFPSMLVRIHARAKDFSALWRVVLKNLFDGSLKASAGRDHQIRNKSQVQ